MKSFGVPFAILIFVGLVNFLILDEVLDSQIPFSVPIYPNAEVSKSTRYDYPDGSYGDIEMNVQHIAMGDPEVVQDYYLADLKSMGWHHYTNECGVDDYRIWIDGKGYRIEIKFQALESKETVVDIRLLRNSFGVSCDILYR